MKKMKKRLFAALLATAMVASFASCGSSSETTESQTDSTAEEGTTEEGSTDFSGVTLKYWTAPFGEDDGAFFNENLASWCEETGATVEVQVTPWENYEEKIMTGVAGGTGPDVVYMYNEMLYNYIEQEQLVPLDDYFTEEEKENYIYWDNGQIMGKQYILPYVVGAPRILFANMDLLAEAGYEEIPTTWDELKEVAIAVEEATGKTGFDQYWGGYFGDLDETYFPYLWQAGGDIVDEEGNLTLDSEEALKAAEFVYSLKEEGILPKSCTSRDGTAVSDDFKNGEVAMFVSSSTGAEKFTEAGINWDFIPFTTDVEGGTFVANDSLVLMTTCENKEAGIALMKELTSPEIMQKFHETCYKMPPITKEETYADQPEFESMYTECADEFHALPVMKNSSQILTALFSNLQEMMMDQKTPEQALQDTMDYAATLN